MRLRAAFACLALAVPVAAFAESSIARFEGGIGSHPNTPVLTTPSGGQPWVIASLSADVKSDGRISVAGRGLLLGGGGNIGRNGGQSVHARLVCGGVAQDTATNVPLEADGDFRIDESFAVAPPNPCANAILLIVNTNGSWFAAGIPKN